MKPGSAVILAAGVLVGGCAGYNLQLGTTGYNVNEFQQVYTVPATSLEPWAGRVATVPLPPPDDGSSGASTLPTARSALPAERTPPAKPGG